jgi:hypothetical protein
MAFFAPKQPLVAGNRNGKNVAGLGGRLTRNDGGRRIGRSVRRIGAGVADQPARETDQGQPCPVSHVPDGRGRGAAADVPGILSLTAGLRAPPAPASPGAGIGCDSRPTAVVRLMKAKQPVPPPYEPRTRRFGCSEVGCGRILLRCASMIWKDRTQQSRNLGNAGLVRSNEPAQIGGRNAT